MTITDVWSMALAPVDVYDDPFDDAPDCLSRLYVPAGSLSLGPLSCSLDHRASGLPWLHGTVLAGHSKEWTDEMAALSLVEFGPSARRTGPLCVECEIRPQSAGGRCQVCTAGELANDNIESEAA